MSEGGKKLFIRTYGCQMNVYDSQRMADALAPEGYREVNSAEEADLVLINTCHIREKASEKVFSEIGRMRQLRDQKRADGSDLKIGITGCVAQAEGDEILRRAPAVDLVVGPQSYHRLPELLAGTNARKPVDIEFPEEDKFGFLPAPSRAATMARGLTSFLTIQEGCDKFCTFCVVPYTRGAEVSRPAKDILREAEGLADAGVKELTLLGQNVNAYLGPDGHGGALDLAGLLAQLARVNGIERLRYTTSHPRDMDDALIAAHRDIAELMPYLHLPVQSGSDRVLDAMNRRHSVGDYLELVTRIRAVRPDIALSGDFIVGFPGESEADFEATLGLVRTVGYAAAYSFKYSPRPGTPAAEMGDQVPEEVKSERLGRLQRLILAQQDGFNDSCIGNRLPVLLEKAGRNQGQLVGRSPYLQPVHLDAEESLIGSIQQVEITGRTKNSLHGKIVTDSAHNSDSIEELTGPPPVVRSFAV